MNPGTPGRLVSRSLQKRVHSSSFPRAMRKRFMAMNMSGEHIQALVDRKRRGRRHRATDHLAQAAPASRDLLMRAAERGDNLGAITSALSNLLDRYGAAELQAAIIDALAKGVPHHNAVRQVLERRRDDRGRAPPVAVILPAHVQARDRVVRTGSLDVYDKLVEASHDEP